VDEQTVLAWSQPQASLVVRQGAGVGMTFSITGEEIILGREEGLGISIRDPEVSRRHARVFWQSADYYVEDLGSTNGTFLNGTRITSPQPLRAGDAIGIGQTLLVFQTEVEATQAQQPEPLPAQPVPPPAVSPAPQKRRGGKCLLWGCGCLVLLGLLLVILVAAATFLFAEEIQPILDDLRIPVQLTMLYAKHLLA
jgi:hypothetical protein